MKKRSRVPSLATLWVLGFVFKHPLVYEGQMTEKGGIKAGTLYPLLISLVEAKMLDKVEEDDDPEMLGRPRRTYYRLTEKGERYARKHQKILDAVLAYVETLVEHGPLEPIHSFK
jgi:DNA-binding PadR family transcriptional regulator